MSEINLQNLILEEINKNDIVNTLNLSNKLKIDHQKIIGCMISIQTFPDIIICNSKQDKIWELSEEGNYVCLNGSHEFNIFKNVPNEGIDQKELMSKFNDLSVAKLGFSKAMQNGWLIIDNSLVKKKIDNVKDEIPIVLEMIKNLKFNDIDNKIKNDLKKRKLIEEKTMKSFDILKGSGFTLALQKMETDLNSTMIIKGTWKDKSFKNYNFNALGVIPEKGHLHPLLKAREQFRQIFLEMGFVEMPTNNYVESSFWNFDALFQPQQHPARNAHDTFFLNVPKNCNKLPQDYLEKVKKIHSEGGYGSQGYKYDWKLSEAQKNLLRTHTTAVSTQMLYKAAQKYKMEKIIKPLKYFSIDKVFRNETLDATHLAEFFQIEGVVANIGLTLGDLMGILEIFFKKLGIEKLKFKPAYNPYTEPSMEIFSYHSGLKKWVEIGNSGMFRPEMLLPMGLPENLNVIAWGLSLERPTMIKYGINNIRSLSGHKIDLEMVYNNPFCILDEK